MIKGDSFFKLYDRVILSRPGWTVVILLISFAALGYWIKDFKLDASADSLILEHDEDLRYFRSVAANYESPEFLILTYHIEGADLLSDKVLNTLKALRSDLSGLKRVASVVTILDVPLLRSPPIALKDIKSQVKTLESPDVNKSMAFTEFQGSPIYQEMLVSHDMCSTALLINFQKDENLIELANRRSHLREKKYNNTLTDDELLRLAAVENEYQNYQVRVRSERHQDIISIRKIMDQYRDSARLFLGGVPMVVDDMITFIKKDLKVFGLGMLIFLIFTLGIIFKKMRWILLPMCCCIFSVVVMMGGLGLFGWNITVISSNFISIQLIITMSFTIHLIVRYRELLHQNPDAENRDLVKKAVQMVFMPCFFSCTTTIAGFSSLLMCNILPVVNFGWMMSMGLCVSLGITFLFFPSALMLMKKPVVTEELPFGLSITAAFARFTQKQGVLIYTGAFLLMGFIVYGATQLKVENSFIKYFKKSTEIYQGMKMIDQELGGTTILDVILNFTEDTSHSIHSEGTIGHVDGKDDFDEFDEFKEEESSNPEKYWFTLDKIQKIEQVHDYMDGLKATGKVLSLATLYKTARQLTNKKSLDNFELALLFNELPEQFQHILITPYVSIEHNQARIFIRMIDSMEGLQRDTFLKKVNVELHEKLGLSKGSFRLTGLMVLYNNMLQSLFKSQIRTIGMTVILLMIMFLVLFRSLKISLIALAPNLLSSFLVLGILGIFNIPLDMMTITIVAISVGIAVDNTIHYLYRFKREFAQSRDYWQTMHRCHASIGNAMYYTSITIIVGFSILSFSNFVPTTLFGLLTGLAMATALLNALTLLPRLIILFKPF
ncbi:MAG: MMPL family transporter [bacterium]